MITTVWKHSEKSQCSFAASYFAKAQKAANAGVSETVRKGLELLAASDTYDQLLRMRGKAKFSINWNRLGDDRRFN